jgi:hypothetical protein
MNLTQIDFNAIFVNLAANLIWLILGGIIAIMIRYFHIVFPTKQLWGLLEPEKAIICTATTKVDTGKYLRPSTGIGQLKAITHIVTSLNKAYKKFDFKNILSSEEEIKQGIENDVILLGGPKNNKITKLFFEKFDFYNLALQNEDGAIYWQKTNNIYQGTTEDGKVRKDYGIIIKMNNLFSTEKNTKILLFSGCHTYGTIAAARYFCEYSHKFLKWKKKKNYILLLSCDVRDGYPVNIKLEDKIFLTEELMRK